MTETDHGKPYTDADVAQAATTFWSAWTTHQAVHPILGQCDPHEPAEECCDRHGLRAVLDALTAAGWRKHGTAGICGNGAPMPALIAGTVQTHCALTAGHAGWHQDDNGARWQHHLDGWETRGAPVKPGETPRHVHRSQVATLAQIAAESAQLDDDLAAGRVADRLGDPPPNTAGGSRCTCPQVDVSLLHEPPGTRTVPGYPAPACPEHGRTKPKHDHTTGYPTFAPDAELVVNTSEGPQQWTGARWNEHVHAAAKAGNGVLELLRICPTPTCTTACPANPDRAEG